jgi:hypothetical protein
MRLVDVVEARDHAPFGGVEFLASTAENLCASRIESLRVAPRAASLEESLPRAPV